MPRRNRNKKQSHQEIIKKRNEKKQRKLSSVKSKEYHLKEFLKLSSKEDDLTKKDMVMQIMNIVEEVNEEGLNDKRYMDIMDLLMKIHKSEEQIDNDIWSDWEDYDNIPVHEERNYSNEIINSYNRLTFPSLNEREEYEQNTQETVVEIQHLTRTLDEMDLHDGM